MLDYEKQQSFLSHQRWWLLSAGAACALLIAETWTIPMSVQIKIGSTFLACALFYIAYYLPNYLGMDADAQRRPRWVARMSWWLLAAMAITTAAFRSWPALAATGAAAILYLFLTRWLRRP
ncbi:MAG TPA: hypothetical protein VN862_08460, partial [Candidatus Acidoferrales bacterium]|nr:hypothetical protein [Candidatus Acidoferrales bacterium]